MVEALEPETLEVSWHPDSTLYIKQVLYFSCVPSILYTVITALINVIGTLLKALKYGVRGVR